MEASDETSLFLALTETSFVKSIAYVFVIAISPVIWMVRWLATFSALNTADLVAASAIQTSQKEAYLA